jgi:hypothetical protein
MSNKLLLKPAAIFSLLLGSAMAFVNEATLLSAEVTTGQGSSVLDHPAARALNQSLHGAALATQQTITAVAGQQLVTGILLILLGFFLHALFLSQQTGERRVHVTAAPTQKPVFKKGQWFWVEMKI